MSTAWLQLTLPCNQDQVDEYSDLILELGAVSVTYTDAGDQAILETAPGETRLWDQLKVTGLFPAESDYETQQQILSSLLPDQLRTLGRFEVLPDQQWERAWMEHFKPMPFGEKLWIYPRGHEYEEDGRVVVELDPGLAFGTGTHATTALCLKWLDQHIQGGEQLIDFGCGSGVLAIAALKLGAAQADCTDHEPQALTATRDNAKQNHVEQGISTTLDSKTLSPKPLVLANILAITLIDLRDIIGNLVTANGSLVMSGVLESQATEVINAYPEFDFAPVSLQNGWCIIHGIKRKQ